MANNRVPEFNSVESPPRRSDIEYEMLADGELIGSGGQAVVKRVSIPGPEPPDIVAVKELQASSKTLDREVVESFFEEVNTWTQLAKRERTDQYQNTDHIVGIVAVGNNGLPWIAMEYMDAGTLAHRLDGHPDGLPIKEALWIAGCLCKGIKFAHDNGVAHLDLKPGNVLFRETADDKWNFPKIADWGLARTLLTDSRSIEMLSVEYAAPEQFNDEKYGKPDKYTDIYQIGSIIYELLTGEPPHTGSATSIMHDVVNRANPTPPSSHREAVPQALDNAVLKALSTKKPQRYRGSIDRLGDAINNIKQSAIDDDLTFTDSAENGAGSKEESISRRTKQTEVWPMFQGGPARTSHQDTTGPCDSITPQWNFLTDAQVGMVSSPAVANGNVFVGCSDNMIRNSENHVYSIDATTGSQQWQFTSDGGVNSSPAVADGTVYVGSNEGCVYALDANDGSQQWRFEVDSWVKSSPVVVDGTIYIGCNDCNLYAIDSTDGTEQWKFATDGVVTSPAVVDSTIYIGSTDTHVYAIDASSGTQRWKFKTQGAVESSPAVADETVYIGSNDGNIYAIDATTSTREWQFQTQNWVSSSPAVTEEGVFVGNEDGNIYNIDAISGTQQWCIETDGWVRSSPAVADGTVYVGSDDGKIYALNINTGSKQWTFQTKDMARSSPAVANGIVYIGSCDGSIYALSESER